MPTPPVEAPPQPVLGPLATDADGRTSRRVLVRATHRAAGLLRNLPSFNAIRDALARINWSEVPGPDPVPHVDGSPVPTAWVGPVPRVVRRGDNASAAQETDVAWILQLATGDAAFTDAMVAAAQRNRKLQIEAALARISGTPEDPAGGWSGVSMHPYAEALHGPLTWWQSGYAGRTRTFERYPAVGEVDMQENPQGPTTEDLQNPDYLTWMRQQGLLPTVGFPWGVLAGGTAALLASIYLVAKLGGGSREVVIRADRVRRRKGGA